MGRRQERLRAKRDYAALDTRCAYCGNDQPGTLTHAPILAYGMMVCRDSQACRERRDEQERSGANPP